MISSFVFQDAMVKDTLERTREPNLNLKPFLQNAYAHPVFKAADNVANEMVVEEPEPDRTPDLVATKRGSRRLHSGSAETFT